MDISTDLTSFFSDLFQDLPCEENTRAYIINLFTQYRSAQFDLSKESIGLAFLTARNKNDFLLYQTIGDWVFFASSLYPESLRHANQDYYFDLGRLSYFSCYRLLNRSWQSYERLADSFIPLSRHIHYSFQSSLSLP